MTDLNFVDIENGSVEVEVFKKTDAALAVLHERYSVVPDVETKEGYKEAKSALKELVSYRTGLEKERKRIKQPYIDAGKLIDSEAKRITAELVELETPIKEAKQEVDEREKRQKEERLNKYRDRIQAILNNVDLARNASSDEIADLIEGVESISCDDFYELKSEAIEARSKTLDQLGDMYSQKLEYERNAAEREKLEKERKEIEAKRQLEKLLADIKSAPAEAMDMSKSEAEGTIEWLINLQEFQEEAQEAVKKIERLLPTLEDDAPEPEPEPEPVEEAPASLNEYQRGYVDGLQAFAWWKDGVQYVGTSGTTLEQAINDFLRGK